MIGIVSAICLLLVETYAYPGLPRNASECQIDVSGGMDSNFCTLCMYTSDRQFLRQMKKTSLAEISNKPKDPSIPSEHRRRNAIVEGSKGIIFSAGTPWLLRQVRGSIEIIRNHWKSDIPIEVYATAAEYELLTDVASQLFAKYKNCTFKNLGDSQMLWISPTGDLYAQDKFYTKILALLNTQFHKVMLLDADSFPLINPSELFDSDLFSEVGAIFFRDVPPDDWKGATLVMSPQSEIWERLNLTCYVDDLTQESGQMLVNKLRVDKALPLLYELGVIHFKKLHGYHTYGDKELYHLALRANNVPYYLERTTWRSVGFWNSNRMPKSGKIFGEAHTFRGFGMLHSMRNYTDPTKFNPAFLHMTPWVDGRHPLCYPRELEQFERWYVANNTHYWRRWSYLDFHVSWLKPFLKALRLQNFALEPLDKNIFYLLGMYTKTLCAD